MQNGGIVYYSEALTTVLNLSGLVAVGRKFTGSLIDRSLRY